jgi:hypothetical protein
MTTPDDTAPEGGWLASPDTRARPVHYSFVHHALRSVALSDPLFYLGVLASPDALKFLGHLLQQVVQHMGLTTPPPDFNLDDLTVHPVRVGGFPCAIVELPRPIAQTEAFFSAAVLLTPLDTQPMPEKPAVRYFTLEQSFDLDGTPFAMMCEWTDTAHMNFGGGPPPRLAAFVAAIEHLIQPSATEAQG